MFQGSHSGSGETVELALTKCKKFSKPVTDANGLAWVNPYRQEVWEYLTELAEMAADLGFDEIQYDYVRFPVGSDANAADYGVDMDAYPKRQAIQDFLAYAQVPLPPSFISGRRPRCQRARSVHTAEHNRIQRRIY